MLLSNWIDISKYIDMFRDELSVLNFDFSRAVGNLEKMGIGMLVIFVIIGIIILATIAINKLFREKS